MNAADRLRAGELLILPTDSLPGLHALATHPDAAASLRAIKGSEDMRPFLLLVSDPAAALRIGAPHEAHRELPGRAWPGPYTFLLNPLRGCPAGWIGAEGRVAIRVPGHPGLRGLLRELGAPLFSTSANRAGEAAALDLDAASASFPDLVAVPLADGPVASAPSTLVDLGDDPWRLLRPGAGPWPLPATP